MNRISKSRKQNAAGEHSMARCSRRPSSERPRFWHTSWAEAEHLQKKTKKTVERKPLPPRPVGSGTLYCAVCTGSVLSWSCRQCRLRPGLCGIIDNRSAERLAKKSVWRPRPKELSPDRLGCMGDPGLLPGPQSSKAPSKTSSRFP